MELPERARKKGILSSPQWPQAPKCTVWEPLAYCEMKLVNICSLSMPLLFFSTPLGQARRSSAKQSFPLTSPHGFEAGEKGEPQPSTRAAPLTTGEGEQNKRWRHRRKMFLGAKFCPEKILPQETGPSMGRDRSGAGLAVAHGVGKERAYFIGR